MPSSVSRAKVEERARDFLLRSQDVGSNGNPKVNGARFEAVLKREIEETIRQLRALGSEIVD